MKQFLANLPKTLIAFFATVVITMVVVTASAVATWGPDRPTKVWTAQENGFNYVTYNSYTNVPNGIGDERDFLRGVVTQRDGNWQDPVNDISNNDVITAKIYIHNNADPLLNDAAGQPGIARDVNVRVAVPKGLEAVHDVEAFISASNAQPKIVNDTLTLKGVNASIFEVNYVPGSVKMGGQKLSDSIFTTGVKLDDQKGCFEYKREITFEMKVTKPGYQIQKTARLKGEDATKWRDVVNAKRGDTIEWRISFQNIGSLRLNDVKVVDDLPSYVDIVPNSVELVNGNYPNGYKYDSSAIQNNGDMVNINIDDYMPGSNAFVYLATTIEDHKDIRCGIHQIANVVYVTPSGLGTLNDNAKVNVINETCDKPSEPVYSCDLLTAKALGSRKYQFTTSVTASPAERVKVKSYHYNFGDATDILLTDKNTVEHQYAKDGTYKAKVDVTFLVDNAEKKVSSKSCEVTVSMDTKGDVTPPPTQLPNTGAGEMVAGIMAATAGLGALAHRKLTLRRQ